MALWTSNSKPIIRHRVRNGGHRVDQFGNPHEDRTFILDGPDYKVGPHCDRNLHLLFAPSLHLNRPPNSCALNLSSFSLFNSPSCLSSPRAHHALPAVQSVWIVVCKRGSLSTSPTLMVYAFVHLLCELCASPCVVAAARITPLLQEYLPRLNSMVHVLGYLYHYLAVRSELHNV
jgi:hypothetical protein